ncbi:hypothetical protein HanXRQr2_Chr11g0503101 [Helianthus annuus]|uniref:Uncharacterized protein n=1 Tax=Helianthus annuus TaxID=4232 RepID=A0A9K3HQU9_HELAN|nr:hypothetical protein HanXRQr2_Chr11g0503101 [Helianthus annuus]
MRTGHAQILNFGDLIMCRFSNFEHEIRGCHTLIPTTRQNLFFTNTNTIWYLLVAEDERLVKKRKEKKRGHTQCTDRPKRVVRQAKTIYANIREICIP